ncbi:MAG: OmpA family protein [Polyangiaceae bacterium]|nr:OmpA family protein [Polyangiaceae bacterium]MCW5789939.1 OmpA family protein [Polyangiaceae bacterium]
MLTSRTFKLLFPAALVIACGSDPKEPPASPTGGTDVGSVNPTPVDSTLPADDPNDDPRKGQINISEEIKRACGLSDAEAYFAYNSANVRPQDDAVLKKLATCFASGPLKDRTMQLVGHADPRGDEEYNMVLGGRRAENVRAALAARGLPKNRVKTSSRGELDATGTDEASYAQDRRVDVLLAD